MRARFFEPWAFVLLVALGCASSATALTELKVPDFTVTDGNGGIEWVVEDPVFRYLLVGTGFSPNGVESIYDNISDPFQWRRVALQSVGESLYVAVHPRELQPLHPGMRRIFVATENQGKFGYFDPAGPGMQFTATGLNKCGTSIGYWPATNAVYFGFLSCTGANQFTQIYKHVVGSMSATFVATHSNSINWAWLLINDAPTPHLYNTAHDVNNLQIRILRQDSDSGYTDIGGFSLPPTLAAAGAHWGHAHFSGGFYYSEFDAIGGNAAAAYRVTGVPNALTRTLLGTAQSTTFLTDTVRNQLFAFGTFQDGGLTVACTLDGVNFSVVDTGNSLGRYGPTASVATVWNTSPVTVAWGHTKTAAGVPSHAVVSVTTGTCR